MAVYLILFNSNAYFFIGNIYNKTCMHDLKEYIIRVQKMLTSGFYIE